MSYNISIVLDVRRAKQNGLFPVKLRVYSRYLKKTKLYPLDIDLSEKQFQHIWINGQSNNLRGENQETRIKLQKIENRANDEAKELTTFNFDQFENKLFRKTGDANNVFYHFEKVIGIHRKKNSISSSESYIYTLKSIQNFINQKSKTEQTKLPFEAVTVEWLENYEEYMLSIGRSITTISIYLKALRAVFNNAIFEKDINADIYPFGNKKYQIPQSRKVTKALSNEQLKTLFEAEPKTPEQEKAKDFWFFSYACNGINLKDVALLNYSDIEDDKFSYYRAKTFKKSKIKTKIDIFLTEYTIGIIEKYGLDDKKGFVFPILNINQSEMQMYRRVKNFTRFVNQHIKQLAKDNGLPEKISSYWARHSFATNAIRKGATMEFISDALNHSDVNVTKNYFAGFEDETKKEFAKQIMKF